MFSGIIEETGTVKSVQPGKLVIAAVTVLQDTRPGDSIAVNGVCLTATSLTGDTFTAEIMPETVRRSNLGLLKPGDRVNLERSLSFGGRLGGHLVQGHIDAPARVSSLRRDGEATIISFEAPPEVMRYVVEKGFIAIDGASLTVTTRSSHSFQISVVDYTRRHSTLGERQVGDTVNLEVDIIAKYVEQFNQPRNAGVTADFLAGHGFLTG